MKKKLAFALMLSVALAMTACGQNETAEAENNTEAETVLNQADTEKSEGVMTYEEYMNKPVSCLPRFLMSWYYAILFILMVISSFLSSCLFFLNKRFFNFRYQ